MKKKITVVGALAILGVLLLMQASTVYAAKPTSVYFYTDFGSFTIDDVSTIVNEDGSPAIQQFFISGVMHGDIGGDFSMVENRVYYYDREGNMNYWKSNYEIVIYTLEGSLVIEAKLKFLYGVPTDFQRPGSWVIVEGTDLLAGTTGRGQMLLAFQFYGKIA